MLGAAFMADIYGLFYWLLILLAIFAALAWLWVFFDHLDIRKGWQALVVCAMTIVLVRVVGAQADHYRAMATAAGTGLQPGDGLGIFAMFFMGVGLLVTPFVLLFSGNGSKKEGSG
jgi:FtsH-binding integral membrane protein